jgi:hypothetical protein
MSIDDIRSLRFIAGITSGFMLAQLVNWPLAYIMPMLLSMLLSGPTVDLKTGGLFLAVIFGSCAFGLLLSMSVINLPIVCIALFGLLLLHIYRAGNLGLPPFAVTLLILGVVVIPLPGLPSVHLSWMLAEGLWLSSLIAVSLAVLFFSIFPHTPEPEAKSSPSSPLPAGIAALISTLIVLPLVTVFYTLFWVDMIVLLIVSTNLAQNVDLAASAKGGTALLAANLLGGVFAIGTYHLLVMAPNPFFMLALVALIATVFARKILSDDPIAPIYGTAFSTVLLLLGSAISNDSKDATEAFLTRIFLLSLAITYVVGSFALLKRAADRWHYPRPAG